MAQLAAGNENSILKIREFLGLNENPDGDTHLRPGELSQCRNFQITRDKHLRLRPGQRTTLDLRAAWDALSSRPSGVSSPEFSGCWTGTLDGERHTVASFGGVLWDIDPAGGAPVRKGTCTQAPASFFGFGNRVYLLNGHEYLSWDGGADSSFQTVEGYIPTVRTASTPQGGGTLLENVNRLTGKRKVKFSPDGKAASFLLEKDIDEVVSVTGTSLSYTVDKAAGTVTFSAAPPAGVNTVVITYRKGNGAREEVERMRFAEFYNGATDTRVFLYGDGTNRCLYSGMDLDKSAPTAEYFPDLFEARVGDENTPITAMVRHYARMMVFKTNSAWSCDYSTATNVLGQVNTVFLVLPVNRQLGNEAPGQARLLENNPLSLAEQNVYQWKASAMGGNITADTRNASRVSDRVRSTLAGFDLSRTVTFNHLRESEYWFLHGGKALILNYAADAWYVYENMPFCSMLEIEGEVYGFTKEGRVRHVSRQYRNDDGAEISAYAETGSMDFDRDWLLKYSPMIFVAIRPESGARVHVTVETNRRSDYPKKLVSAGLAGFNHVDFAHFSFGTNRKPKVKRVKLKVKKATFYKLIFESDSASATVTLLETDIQLRYAGNVK
ncbi:hypothetical protein [uncultured Oscillibacter sp.]|uniref:hypothetical protein n=1 Tax=uncultured Oscillibacter sp. TaxID=876091 RepID=UPI00260E8EC8|nr:hypothetical protein [uncultured Oscillibacter sp.]